MEGGFQGQLDTVYRNEAKLLQENGKLLEDLDLANKRITDLKSELEASDVEINVKSAESRDVLERLVFCEKVRADVESHLVELNGKFSVVSEQYEDLKGRYQTQEGLYNSACKKLESQESKMEDMASKLSDLQKRLEEANQRHLTEQAEKDDFRENLGIEKNRVLVLENELCGLRSLVEETQGENNSLKDDLACEEQRLAELEKELIQILETSKGRAIRCAELEARCTGYDSKIKELEANLVDVKSTALAAKDGYDATERTLRQSITKLESNLHQAVQQEEDLRNEVMKLQNDIDASEHFLLMTTDDVLAEANKKISLLESQISAPLTSTDFEPYLQKLVVAIDLPNALESRHREMLLEYRKLTEEYNSEVLLFKASQRLSKWDRLNSSDVLLDHILNLGVLETMIFETRRGSGALKYKEFNVRELKRSMASELLEEYLDN